jgi:hypothetical protein
MNRCQKKQALNKFKLSDLHLSMLKIGCSNIEKGKETFLQQIRE